QPLVDLVAQPKYLPNIVSAMLDHSLRITKAGRACNPGIVDQFCRQKLVTGIAGPITTDLVSYPTDRLGKSSKERLDLSHIGRLSVIINRAVDCRTLGLVTKLCPMHRVVAIALAGNRIEIIEMVVNPLANNLIKNTDVVLTLLVDIPDRHTCGKNCVVFRSPNLLPRVRILLGIVVTDNRGDASLLQGRNFPGTVICGIKNRIFHSTTPCNPAARAPRTVGRAEPLRYDAFEAELASSVSYKRFSFILLSPLVVARSRRTLLRRHPAV